MQLASFIYIGHLLCNCHCSRTLVWPYNGDTLSGMPPAGVSVPVYSYIGLIIPWQDQNAREVTGAPDHYRYVYSCILKALSTLHSVQVLINVSLVDSTVLTGQSLLEPWINYVYLYLLRSFVVLCLNRHIKPSIKSKTFGAKKLWDISHMGWSRVLGLGIPYGLTSFEI